MRAEVPISEGRACRVLRLTCSALHLHIVAVGRPASRASDGSGRRAPAPDLLVDREDFVAKQQARASPVPLGSVCGAQARRGQAQAAADAVGPTPHRVEELCVRCAGQRPADQVSECGRRLHQECGRERGRVTRPWLSGTIHTDQGLASTARAAEPRGCCQTHQADADPAGQGDTEPRRRTPQRRGPRRAPQREEFVSLKHAQATISTWRRDDNEVRSLGSSHHRSSQLDAQSRLVPSTAPEHPARPLDALQPALVGLRLGADPVQQPPFQS